MRLSFRTPAIALAAIFSLGLMGCPESTDRPLILKSDASDVSIDMAGKWIPDSQTVASADSVIITRTGENVYSVTRYTSDGAPDGVSEYEAWTGRYNSAPYLVLSMKQSPGCIAPGFYFYRLEPAGPSSFISYNTNAMEVLMKAMEANTEDSGGDSTSATLSPATLDSMLSDGKSRAERIVWTKAQH